MNYRIEQSQHKQGKKVKTKKKEEKREIQAIMSTILLSGFFPFHRKAQIEIGDFSESRLNYRTGNLHSLSI